MSSVQEDKNKTEVEPKETDPDVFRLQSENAELKVAIDKLKTQISNYEDLNKAKNGDDPLGVTASSQLKSQVHDLSSQLAAQNAKIVDLEAQLLSKENKIEDLEKQNSELESTLASFKEEFKRIRKQSEEKVEEYEQRIESLSEQLHSKARQGQSKSLLEPFPEEEDEGFTLQVPMLQGGASIGGETQSTDFEYSIGPDSTADEAEENHKKIVQLTQSLRSLTARHKDNQRRLVEAQEERDNMKSVVEDLQKQVDATSPAAAANLRATLHSMEAEISRLERENYLLRTEAEGSCHRSEMESTDFHPEHIKSAFDSNFNVSHSVERKTEDEFSEELIDCTMDIMDEMANATSGLEMGISMTYVQYAGLLSAVQKAIKHLEESKQDFTDTAHSFKMLDRTLSQSLSISRVRVRPPEGERRLDQMLVLIKEKESDLKFMVQMVSELRNEIKGHDALTLQQEVQLEYIRQQLSSSDKVVSLTWENENLKKLLEECKRELKQQTDLNEQQQQELTIQWESKQQAVAAKLSQNHRVSSFSQQLEHAVQAKEALEAEKQELEESLETSREETEHLRQETRALHSQIQGFRYELESEKKKKCGLTAEACQEILQGLSGLDTVITSLEGPLEDFDSSRNDLAQSLSELETKCTDWRMEEIVLKEDKEILLTELRNMKERLSVAESQRQRAEQEKSGLQEILTLTTETTSSEILSLQNQLCEMSRNLDTERDKHQREQTQLKQKIADLQSKVNSLGVGLSEERQKRLQEAKALSEKLEASKKETSNLETRMQSYKEVVANLNRDINLKGDQLKDLQKRLEQASDSCRTEKARADSLKEKFLEMSTQLEGSIQENSSLLENCAKVDALKESIEYLSTEKAELMGAIEAEKTSKAELETKIQSLQEEISEVRDKNRVLNSDLRSMEETMLEEQQKVEDCRSKWEADIESLVHKDTPRDKWPACVLLLVTKCEEFMQAEAREKAEERIKEIQAKLDRTESEAQEREQTHQDQLIEWAEETRTLRDTVDQLQFEMKEREAILQKDLADTKAQSAARINQLETNLRSLTRIHESMKDETDSTISRLKEELSHKTVQLMETQEKARQMMREKDAEIGALKKDYVEEIANRSPARQSIEEDSSSPESLTNLHRELTRLKKETTGLRLSLEDSERTHELRDKANEVIKQELKEYKRSSRRSGLDLDYVKNVLVNAFETGTLPKTSPMFVVLSRLFEFSPEEIERIKKGDKSVESASPTASSILPSWMRS